MKKLVSWLLTFSLLYSQAVPSLLLAQNWRTNAAQPEKNAQEKDIRARLAETIQKLQGSKKLSEILDLAIITTQLLRQLDSTKPQYDDRRFEEALRNLQKVAVQINHDRILQSLSNLEAYLIHVMQSGADPSVFEGDVKALQIQWPALSPQIKDPVQTNDSTLEAKKQNVENLFVFSRRFMASGITWQQIPANVRQLILNGNQLSPWGIYLASRPIESAATRKLMQQLSGILSRDPRRMAAGLNRMFENDPEAYRQLTEVLAVATRSRLTGNSATSAGNGVPPAGQIDRIMELPSDLSRNSAPPAPEQTARPPQSVSRTQLSPSEQSQIALYSAIIHQEFLPASIRKAAGQNLYRIQMPIESRVVAESLRDVREKDPAGLTEQRELVEEYVKAAAGKDREALKNAEAALKQFYAQHPLVGEYFIQSAQYRADLLNGLRLGLAPDHTRLNPQELGFSNLPPGSQVSKETNQGREGFLFTFTKYPKDPDLISLFESFDKKLQIETEKGDGGELLTITRFLDAKGNVLRQIVRIQNSAKRADETIVQLNQGKDHVIDFQSLVPLKLLSGAEAEKLSFFTKDLYKQETVAAPPTLRKTPDGKNQLSYQTSKGGAAVTHVLYVDKDGTIVHYASFKNGDGTDNTNIQVCRGFAGGICTVKEEYQSITVMKYDPDKIVPNYHTQNLRTGAFRQVRGMEVPTQGVSYTQETWDPVAKQYRQTASRKTENDGFWDELTKESAWTFQNAPIVKQVGWTAGFATDRIKDIAYPAAGLANFLVSSLPFYPTDMDDIAYQDVSTYQMPAASALIKDLPTRLMTQLKTDMGKDYEPYRAWAVEKYGNFLLKTATDPQAVFQLHHGDFNPGDEELGRFLISGEAGYGFMGAGREFASRAASSQSISGTLGNGAMAAFAYGGDFMVQMVPFKALEALGSLAETAAEARGASFAARAGYRVMQTAELSQSAYFKAIMVQQGLDLGKAVSHQEKEEIYTALTQLTALAFMPGGDHELGRKMRPWDVRGPLDIAREAVTTSQVVSLAGSAVKFFSNREQVEERIENTVLGKQGPGVNQGHIEAAQKLANETGIAIFLMGSRQIGVKNKGQGHPDTGKSFDPTSDIDLGVIGGEKELLKIAGSNWSSIPNVAHAPLFIRESAEEAIHEGFLVVLPKAETRSSSVESNLENDPQYSAWEQELKRTQEKGDQWRAEYWRKQLANNHETPIDDGFGVLVTNETLHHGSAQKGIQEFNLKKIFGPEEVRDGSPTRGIGVYLTSDAGKAKAYAEVRAHETKTEPVVYETSIQNLRLVDMRVRSNFDKVVRGFGSYLSNEYLKSERFNRLPKWMKDMKAASVSEYLESIQNIEQVDGKPRYVKLNNIQEKLINFCDAFTWYVQSLGYDGVVDMESVDTDPRTGESAGPHDSYVIFDPAKVKIVLEETDFSRQNDKEPPRLIESLRDNYNKAVLTAAIPPDDPAVKIVSDRIGIPKGKIESIEKLGSQGVEITCARYGIAACSGANVKKIKEIAAEIKMEELDKAIAALRKQPHSSSGNGIIEWAQDDEAIARSLENDRWELQFSADHQGLSLEEQIKVFDRLGVQVELLDESRELHDNALNKPLSSPEVKEFEEASRKLRDKIRESLAAGRTVMVGMHTGSEEVTPQGARHGWHVVTVLEIGKTAKGTAVVKIFDSLPGKTLTLPWERFYPYQAISVIESGVPSEHPTLTNLFRGSRAKNPAVAETGSGEKPSAITKQSGGAQVAGNLNNLLGSLSKAFLSWREGPLPPSILEAAATKKIEVMSSGSPPYIPKGWTVLENGANYSQRQWHDQGAHNPFNAADAAMTVNPNGVPQGLSVVKLNKGPQGPHSSADYSNKIGDHPNDASPIKIRILIPDLQSSKDLPMEIKNELTRYDAWEPWMQHSVVPPGTRLAKIARTIEGGTNVFYYVPDYLLPYAVDSLGIKSLPVRSPAEQRAALALLRENQSLTRLKTVILRKAHDAGTPPPEAEEDIRQLKEQPARRSEILRKYGLVFNDYFSDLSINRAAAIEEYVLHGRAINRFLREGTENQYRTAAQFKALIKQIDAIINDSPLENNIALYRGSLYEDIPAANALVPGVKFIENGYTSATLNYRHAAEFAAVYGHRPREKISVFDTIELSAGQKAASLGDMSPLEYEKEFILPRGTTFEVEKIEYDYETKTYHRTLKVVEEPPAIPKVVVSADAAIAAATKEHNQTVLGKAAALGPDHPKPNEIIYPDSDKIRWTADRAYTYAIDVDIGKHKPIREQDFRQAVEDRTLFPGILTAKFNKGRPKECTLNALANNLASIGHPIGIEQIHNIISRHPNLGPQIIKHIQGNGLTTLEVLRVYSAVTQTLGVGLEVVPADRLFETISQNGRGAIVSIRDGRGTHAIYVEGIAVRDGRGFVSILDSNMKGRTYMPMDGFAQALVSGGLMIDPERTPAPELNHVLSEFQLEMDRKMKEADSNPSVLSENHPKIGQGHTPTETIISGNDAKSLQGKVYTADPRYSNRDIPRFIDPATIKSGVSNIFRGMSWIEFTELMRLKGFDPADAANQRLKASSYLDSTYAAKRARQNAKPGEPGVLVRFQGARIGKELGVSTPDHMAEYQLLGFRAFEIVGVYETSPLGMSIGNNPSYTSSRGPPHPSIEQRVQGAGLPESGTFPYVAPPGYRPNHALPHQKFGNRKGFIDKFGNIWVRGTYHGKPGPDAPPFEWDVQLSRAGLNRWKQIADCKNGTCYLNVRPDGMLSH